MAHLYVQQQPVASCAGLLERIQEEWQEQTVMTSGIYTSVSCTLIQHPTGGIHIPSVSIGSLT